MRPQIVFSVLLGLGGPAAAQPADQNPPDKTSGDARLNELRAAPTPKPANDIDPLQLASAHRERAASVDERTNGLWQSWTTSICEGCGNTPSYQDTVRSDFSNRKGLAALAAEAEARKQPPGVPSKPPKDSPGRSLYTDLSPETIDQIRRMPGR